MCASVYPYMSMSSHSEYRTGIDTRESQRGKWPDMAFQGNCTAAVLSDVSVSIRCVVFEDLTDIPSHCIADFCFSAELVRGGVGEV